MNESKFNEVGCTCDTPTGSENRRCSYCRIEKQDNKTDKWKRLQKSGAISCPICPPNKGENAKRKSKRGAKKPKYKDKR